MKNTTLFFLLIMFSGMGYSLVSPLFPSLGKKDNLGEEILGWIISTYSIAGTIFTPIVPMLSKKFSRVKLLSFATFFEATCTLSYGFLPFIDNYIFLITIIFLLRILHGICSAIIGTLVYSLTISLADENETQTSIGNLEIGWSLGTAFGPLFASLFYRLGGYSAPFILLGLLLYVSVYITFKIDSRKLNKDEESDENPPFASFLVYPEIFIILFALIINMIEVTFYFPCLTNHLTNNYKLSISNASLFFIIPIIPYAVIIQFLDNISSKFGIYLTFTIGFSLLSFGPLLLYPCPPVPKSLISIFLGFLIIGSGSSPVFVLGLVALAKNIAKIDSNIDELTANDISSAINNLTISIGDFIGPIIGGFLTSHCNFKVCCFIIFLFGFIYSIIFILYFLKNIKEDINTLLTAKKEEEDEKQNIINKDIFNKDNSFEDQILNKSALEINRMNFGKIDSFLFRKYHFGNKYKRKERVSKISLYTSLTN